MRPYWRQREGFNDEMANLDQPFGLFVDGNGTFGLWNPVYPPGKERR